MGRIQATVNKSGAKNAACSSTLCNQCQWGTMSCGGGSMLDVLCCGVHSVVHRCLIVAACHTEGRHDGDQRQHRSYSSKQGIQ